MRREWGQEGQPDDTGVGPDQGKGRSGVVRSRWIPELLRNCLGRFGEGLAVVRRSQRR